MTKGQRQLRDGGGVEILEGPEDILAAEASRREAMGEGEGEDADSAPAGGPGKRGNRPKPSDS